MSGPVKIVAVNGRADSGISRPFICEGDDGAIYYVKLKSAGYVEIVKEWLAGRLAQELGLPVADCAQVEIPSTLVAGNREYERDLGAGIAFGSREVSGSIELTADKTSADPTGIFAKLLLFDRWIRNQDRKLSRVGGNPNCLWLVAQLRVVLIDHDNAFDPGFDVKEFLEWHAFRSFREAFQESRRTEHENWLNHGAAAFEMIWAELPSIWLQNDYGDPRAGLDKLFFKSVLLSHVNEADFWSLPPSNP